jgi:erythromycin esterase
MEWLKDHNSGLPYRQRAGFYGLDVYSLWESLEAIMTYLGKEDPATAAAAKKALECFEPFEREGQLYAQLSPLLSRSCKEEVVSMLKEIRLKAREYNGDEEAGFNAEQNALIAVNAERYYRSLMELDDKSWNIRDRHMAETLSRLMAFHGKDARAVVWEHNTHIGDARATDMNRAGIVNLGQLAREQYGEEEVVLVGFASYSGTVIAASAWGAPMQEMSVPEAREGSLEAMLHNENLQDRLLVFNRENPHERFNRDYPHRAIGVVYHPERERYGNYVNSLVSSRYDALIYLDSTKALHPLHIRPVLGPIPETYPFGL